VTAVAAPATGPQAPCPWRAHGSTTNTPKPDKPGRVDGRRVTMRRSAKRTCAHQPFQREAAGIVRVHPPLDFSDWLFESITGDRRGPSGSGHE